MGFISFLSVILDQKSIDLIKIIEFQNQEIAVLKAMNKEGRSYVAITTKKTIALFFFKPSVVFCINFASFDN